MKRELRGAVKTANTGAVQFQRTGAEVPRETVSNGGLDQLSRSFGSFFNSVSNSVATVKESELRTELMNIDRENKELAVEGQTFALQGRSLDEATEEQRSRYTFVSSYKSALGANMFNTQDRTELEKTLLEWDTAQRGDPNAYVTDVIKERTQGMDPMVAASYTIAFRKTADELITRNNAAQRELAAERGVATALQDMDTRLSQGEALGPDDIENYYRTVENFLPVSKRNEARDRVNARLFDFAARNPDARWAWDRIENQPDASGITLAQRYPGLYDKMKTEATRRVGAVSDPREAGELDVLEQGLQDLKANNSPDALAEFGASLQRHRAEWGKGEGRVPSDAWRKINGQFLELIGKDAAYRQFGAQLQARVDGVRGAPMLGSDQEANWNRWVAEASQAGLPFAAMATTFAAHNFVPGAVSNRLRAGLTSEKNDDRVSAYMQAAMLDRAFDNNPAKMASVLGSEGMLVYEHIRARAALNGNSREAIIEAANVARVVQANQRRIEDVDLGDKKEQERWLSNTVGHVTSFGRTLGDRLPIFGTTAPEMSGAARAQLERIIRTVKGQADVGYGSLDREAIEKTAARIFLADATYYMVDNKPVIGLRTNNRLRVEGATVGNAMSYTPRDLANAQSQFSDVASTFQGIAPLNSLMPMQGGQGYEVRVKNPDKNFAEPVVAPLGSTLGNIQIPSYIPDYGWQPPGMANGGFMFIPHPDSRGHALLVYRGETADDAAYRMSVEETVRVRQGVERAQANPPTVTGPETDIGSRELPPVNPPAGEMTPEVERMTLGYWLSQIGERLGQTYAARGLINRRDLMERPPLRNIENVEQLQSRLEELMNKAAVSARLLPSGGDPNKAYDAQRFDFIAKVEGVRYRAYDDATGRSVDGSTPHKGNRTIGIGFNMERPDAKQIFRDVLNIPENQFNDYLNGKRVLSQAHVRTLFNYNADEAEKIVENRIGSEIVDKLSKQQRLVLVSLAFNHPQLIGPNLVSAIREGRLNDAAREIRERSNRARNPGIQSRRELEADKFLNVG